jgi:acyl-CoA dehydrogenase
MQEPVSVPLGEDWPEIRDSVRRICADFPGPYWRDLDRREAYPAEFVKALTDAGYLAALIPEEYGGAGLPIRAAGVVLEECHNAGCYAAAAHAQMYTMGSLLRHGSPEQKAKYLPKIASGELRLQAFGVTEPTTGTDTTKLKTRAVREGDHYVINGQKVWTSRALYSDLMLLLARTTPREEVAKKTDGLTVFLVDMREARGKGMEIRPLPAMINHSATEVFFDNLRVPAENVIGQVD